MKEAIVQKYFLGRQGLAYGVVLTTCCRRARRRPPRAPERDEAAEVRRADQGLRDGARRA